MIPNNPCFFNPWYNEVAMKTIRLGQEILTLGTPRGRVLAWLLVSVVIFLAPYQWLAHLSLWGHMGWHGAPSIGLTRAYWLLLHGQPAHAWRRNWLIVPVCTIGLPLIMGDMLRWQKSRQTLPKNLH